MPYVGEVMESEKGYVACVSNGTDAFEIHPMGEPKNRDFYSRDAALMLATSHAAHANAGKAGLGSSWRRLA